MLIFIKKSILSLSSLALFFLCLHSYRSHLRQKDSLEKKLIITNLITSEMNHYENFKNLPQGKFTKNQLKNIKHALSRLDEKIRYVTYNMLFNRNDHKLEKKHRWPSRLPKIRALMKALDPDVIATQELSNSQINEAEEAFKKNYAFIPGFICKDGESYGVFYKKKRFKLVGSKTQFHVTIVQLQDLKTNKHLAIFNTHLAFRDIELREQESHTIAKLIKDYSKRSSVVFSGDLNTFSPRLSLEGLPFYDGNHIHRIFQGAGLKDTQKLALIGHFGPISTYTSNAAAHSVRPFEGEGEPGIILDYIYVNNLVKVLTHGTESARVDGDFPSDHMPVVSDLLLG